MPSFNQGSLIDKLNNYLILKKRKPLANDGHCHGLTLLWLQRISENEEHLFYELVREIILCEEKNFCFLEVRIEKLIGYIEWLQNSSEYLPDLNQLDVDKLLETDEKISFSAVFNYRDLTRILELTVLPGKMLCISAPFHTIGVYCRDKTYYIYDPNYSSGKAKIITSLNILQDEIIKTAFENQTHLKKYPLLFNIVSNQKNPSHKILINKPAILDFLTDSNAKIFREDNLGVNSLFIAAENNDIDMVKILLEKGASVNSTNTNQQSCLSIACEKGYYEIAQLLLKFNADAGQADNHWETPLHKATTIDNPNILKLLLNSKKTFIDAQNDAGETAVFLAIKKEKMLALQFLLNNNANPFIAAKNKKTPLSLALEKKLWSACLLILKYINDINFLSIYVKDKLIENHLNIQECFMKAKQHLTIQEIIHFENLFKDLLLMKKTSSSSQTKPTYHEVSFSLFAPPKNNMPDEEEDTPEPQFMFCTIL